ncbi:MAG: MBL fold metallo-hydrolase [Thiomargarita sp.]|nr:MBL fold metallo-hydrolase [Thiomargarita sp.]
MDKSNLNYIRFWGVRGSYPSPFGSHMRVGGNTSCVELRVDDHILICDGGSGIIPLGNSLLGQKDIKELTIIITHYHWDHISGLPFFIPAFIPGWKLNIYGPGESQAEIERCVSGQMVDPYFPVDVETWMADINYLKAKNSVLEYGPFKIETFNVHHPGSTFGYRIQVHGKQIIYASDNELRFIEQTTLDQQDEMTEDELIFNKAMEKEEWDKSVETIRDSHVFIHDAQYTPEDYAKKRGWGHSCYIDTTNCAMDANVKQLYLFHVDPNYNDDKIETLHQAVVEQVLARKSNMDCHIAREGLIIDIDRL